ncbi:hypothetical protein ABIB73_004255 [Bradyrhizobium sp. F1.4.3]|uniref:hypothetical protein n=1 Tax=Bradyrhizobium sp. F1.4.3 TaxID=3156356 RepID=UPI0033947CEC
MTRNYAFVLPGFLLLLVSGSNEVGSWEMSRLGPDRAPTPIVDGRGAINIHPMPPIVTVGSADTDRRMTEEAYAKANGLSPDEVKNRFRQVESYDAPVDPVALKSPARAT